VPEKKKQPQTIHADCFSCLLLGQLFIITRHRMAGIVEWFKQINGKQRYDSGNIR